MSRFQNFWPGWTLAIYAVLAIAGGLYGLISILPKQDLVYRELIAIGSLLLIAMGPLFWIRSRLSLHLYYGFFLLALGYGFYRFVNDGFQIRILSLVSVALLHWGASSLADTLDEESVLRGELPPWVLNR